MSLLRYRGSWLKAQDVLDLAAVATLVPEQAKVAPAALDDAPLGRVPDRVRRMGGSFRAEVGRNVRPMAAAPARRPPA